MKRLRDRSPAAFMTAGGVLSVTFAYGMLGEGLGLWEVVWPLIPLGLGLTVLGGCLGLLGLAADLRQSAPWLTLIGTGAALVAGLGAAQWIVAAAMGLSPWELPEHYATVILLGGTGGLLVAALLFGVGVLRTGTHPGSVGVLLTMGGLSFLAPLTSEALGWQPPDWLSGVVLGLWSVVFLGVGLVLRRSGTPRRPARTTLASVDQDALRLEDQPDEIVR